MRCQEVLDQLPVLAYNELDNESAARCHEHLAGCAACQAEWKSIRGALSLLDQAPRRQTQVDLAAICLRIARQQRRGRAVSRWVIGASAAAALVVGMIAAQLLAVNLEPGRLTVAWSAKPAPDAQEAGDQATGDRVGPLHATHDGGSGAGQATQPPGALAANLQRSPNTLVLLFEGDQSFARRRLRNALSLDDDALGASFDQAFSRSREPERKNNSSAEPEPITYSGLRRKMIEGQPKRIPGATPPGA
jgi:anti-sigma factor RsiW